MQTQRVNIGAESRYWALSPGCPIVGKRDTSFLPRFCGLTAALEFPPGSGRHKISRHHNGHLWQVAFPLSRFAEFWRFTLQQVPKTTRIKKQNW